MGRVYARLTLEKRRKIERWRHAGVSLNEMARVLRRAWLDDRTVFDAGAHCVGVPRAALRGPPPRGPVRRATAQPVAAAGTGRSRMVFLCQSHSRGL